MSSEHQSEHSDEVLENSRLGMLLLQQKLISETQLANALREHLITERRLGDILVERGYVPAAVIEFYATEQHRLRELFDQEENFFRESSRLGDLLANARIVDRQLIDQALEEQRRSGRQLGDILVDHGHLSRQTLEEVLSLQQKFRRAAISAAMSLVLSVSAVPSAIGSGNTATGQISITLRIQDSRQSASLVAPAQINNEQGTRLEFNAGGQSSSFGLEIRDGAPRFQLNSDEEILRQEVTGSGTRWIETEDYRLEFSLDDSDEMRAVMSIAVTPT